MTKEEAQRFLEDRDFCMKHLVKQVKAKGARHATCPECVADLERHEQDRIDEAIRVLRGQSERPPMSMESWTPCDTGRHAPINQRVYVMCIGFRNAGKSGGEETYCVGKPLFWRPK